jgi:DNA-binding NtrC family response regulator
MAGLAHRLSPWHSGPFLEVSCPLISDALSESELFGHEKGAFTGAIERKVGKVDLARGGTMVFEEIGDATERLQAKLLRLFDNRRYERVGGVETLSADVRFIAATNRDLAELVRQGKFREDLFHRLNVVSIRLPTLAERREEIPGFVASFLEILAAENGKTVPSVEPELLDFFAAYDWPGNLRELRNALERMLVLGDPGCLRTQDLPPVLAKAYREAESRPAWGWKGRGPSSQEVKAALDKSRGNRRKAAARLGISRPRLYRLLVEYGLK